MARARGYIVVELPAGTIGRALVGIRQMLEAGGMPRGGYRRLAVIAGDSAHKQLAELFDAEYRKRVQR